VKKPSLPLARFVTSPIRDVQLIVGFTIVSRSGYCKIYAIEKKEKVKHEIYVDCKYSSPRPHLHTHMWLRDISRDATAGRSQWE
jgi:hypothetical protein